MTFLQDPHGFICTFGLLPIELAQMVFAPFVGGSKEDIRTDTTLRVCVSNLENAVLWMCTYCYDWLEVAYLDKSGNLQLCAVFLQNVLQEYAADIGNQEGSIPLAIFSSAMPCNEDFACLADVGPAQIALANHNK